MQLVVGMVLLVATTFVHAAVTGFVIALARRLNEAHWSMQGRLRPMVLIAGVVLSFFMASLFEVFLWAITYMSIGALSGLEPALYFSMVTFTTLGYGDVVLTDTWRLLGSFQAATGIIVFGWTTAVIVALLQRIIRIEEQARRS